MKTARTAQLAKRLAAPVLAALALLAVAPDAASQGIDSVIQMGEANRDMLRITGSGWGPKKGKVKLVSPTGKSKKATVVSWTETVIVARSSKKAKPGLYDVEVKGKGKAFPPLIMPTSAYIEEAVIEQIDISSLQCSDKIIRLYGQHFHAVGNKAKVRIGGKKAKVKGTSDLDGVGGDWIDVGLPKGLPTGTTIVKLKNKAGKTTFSIWLDVDAGGPPLGPVMLEGMIGNTPVSADSFTVTEFELPSGDMQLNLEASVPWSSKPIRIGLAPNFTCSDVGLVLSLFELSSNSGTEASTAAYFPNPANDNQLSANWMTLYASFHLHGLKDGMINATIEGVDNGGAVAFSLTFVAPCEADDA